MYCTELHLTSIFANEEDLATIPTSNTLPHSGTPCMPSSPISLRDGTRRDVHSRPELDESTNLHLPPSSPIQSPGSIASVSDSESNREVEFDNNTEQCDNVEVENEIGPMCSGQWVQWTPGPIWNTYPYQRHDKCDLPWVPIGWKTGWVQLRSLECAQRLVTDLEQESGTCYVCYDLLNSRTLIKLMERASASNLEPRTPWNYLTSAQLKALLQEKEKKIQVLKLKVHSPFCSF
jgi:hypothetical protein